MKFVDQILIISNVNEWHVLFRLVQFLFFIINLKAHNYFCFFIHMIFLCSFNQISTITNQTLLLPTNNKNYKPKRVRESIEGEQNL